MKYNINLLASKYIEYLRQNNFDIVLPSQTFDPSTYNEYTYQKLIRQYELLYQYGDSLELTEQFLKGE